MAARLVVMATLMTSLAGGCDCSDEPAGLQPLPPWDCAVQDTRPGADDVACPDGTPTGGRFVRGACQAARCDAEESGCCPGQVCTGGGECQIPPSRMTECTDDGNCESGQLCLDRPLVSTTARTCGYLPVDVDGSCPLGLSPFNQRCVQKAPCGGGCPEGRVCNIDLDRCEESPTTSGGCDQVCTSSQILVYTDPNNMLFSQCCEIACECQTLPPLSPGNWGRFSDLIIGPDTLYVSAYDTTYGDLVVATLGSLSAEEVRLDYVDGVPTGGATVADPNGPRGGRDAPGPDVGTYTSIALQPGTNEPRVAFYDVEAKDLRFAAYNTANQTWSVHRIDADGDEPDDGADDGDVGRYTSLAIDSTGIAHVTYYAHRVQAQGAEVTTAMYARALTTAPAGPSDWVRVPIETFPTCATPCTGDDVCIRAPGTGVPECRAPRTDCAATCACDHTCVDIGGAGQCRPTLPARLREPCDGSCGTGLDCVSDGAGGDVCLQEQVDGCGAPCTGDDICVRVDDTTNACRLAMPYSAIEGLPEGVGLFTALALQPDSGGGTRPTVVYYDRIQRQLRGAVANFPATGDVTAGFVSNVIACDPEAPDDDIGQHPSLAVGPDGSIGVAYQARGGETLWLLTGADVLDVNATIEEVDDGVRGEAPNQSLRLVGAYAAAEFDSLGNVYIVYQDQTENDLVIAYRSGTDWTHETLLSDGAFGSFADLEISGRTAYVANYLRGRDDFDRDVSRLVVQVVDLDSLP